MKNILCPTDFSMYARKALDFALDIALHNNAKLTLLNVFRSKMVLKEGVYEPNTSPAEESTNQLLQLKEVILSDPKYKDLEIEILSMEGFAVEVIIRSCVAINASLIVMGTKGVSGLEKIILGSNAAKVIEDAAVPVLAVPEGAEYKGFKSIVMATDWLDEDEPALAQLGEFANFFDAHVHFLHVLEEDEDYTEDQLTQIGLTYAEMLKSKKTSSHVLISDSVIGGIHEFIKSNPCELIATITRKRSFLDRLFIPSLTKKLAYQGELPILAFHE